MIYHGMIYLFCNKSCIQNIIRAMEPGRPPPPPPLRGALSYGRFYVSNLPGVGPIFPD